MQLVQIAASLTSAELESAAESCRSFAHICFPVQSIERKSVNKFTGADIRKTEKLAQRYYQEMGAKSPFFRAWFGDWRANDSTAVQIANRTGDARGEVTNADTGWTIRVSAKVFVETNAHKAKANTGAMRYLPYINDIVRKAVLLDTYGMGKSKSAGSLLMHNLYAIVDDGNGTALLKLYVEEMNDVNTEATGKRAYQLQNIENQQLAVTGSGNSLAVSNSTADVNTVADLFAAVKRKGELKNAKSVNSLLLNADGSPKIMYHGSPNSFTVFDIRFVFLPTTKAGLKAGTRC